tara:strand:- start:1852 stop:3003 length:1152 start_codon:yes stop_codon:yes gene_type:complete
MALSEVNNRSQELTQKMIKAGQAEEQDVTIAREVTVIFQNEKYVLRTDGGDLDARSKLTGHGFTITESGDFVVISGPGGKDNPCGGRMMANTTGGKLEKHGGPIIQEAHANKSNAIETDNESSTKGVARSTVLYGDDNLNVKADVKIDAVNVTIEASGLLSLVGINGIKLQAGPEGGGPITMQAGSITQVAANKEEYVIGQKMVVSSESTEVNYDPRGTKALISPGHQSIKYMGDVKHVIMGAYRMDVKGVSTSPFIIDKKTSIGINASVGDVKFGTLAGSMHLSATGGAKMPSLDGVKPGNITINSALGTQIKSSTPLIGKVSIDTGIVDITAGADVAIDATTKVDITGKTGVDIEATTGSLKLEAKVGNVDIDAGLKILLN